MIHKRYTTLLEMLIALGLTTILLTSLLFYYNYVAQLNNKISNLEHATFQQRYLQHRLSDLFTHALPVKDSKHRFFYSTNDPDNIFLNNTQNLVFSYDNGIVLNPPLANEVLGRLYIDRDNNLTLMTWPARDQWEPNGPATAGHKEVLLPQVDSLTFEFLILPKKQKDPPKENEPTNPFPELPTLGWHQDLWKKEYDQIPSAVKIIIRTKPKDELITYAFPIPKSKDIVHFER